MFSFLSLAQSFLLIVLIIVATLFFSSLNSEYLLMILQALRQVVRFPDYPKILSRLSSQRSTIIISNELGIDIRCLNL